MNVRSTLAAVFGTCFLAAAGTGSAFAACGQHKVPTYDDVTAIRYARTACFGHCPNYEVLFTQQGYYYVGRGDVAKHGTYEAPLGDAFSRARRALAAHEFYKLNARESNVMDVPHLVITVERCSVTTRLNWPQLDARADITALFDALDAIVARGAWKKTRDSVDSPLSFTAPIVP